MKSPNMMSTTGRIPVMAAPTPMPVMPASEIGESITALSAEFFHQTREHLERRPRLGDIFADDEHSRIAAHLLRQRLVDGLGEGDLANWLPACYGRLVSLTLALSQGERE